MRITGEVVAARDTASRHSSIPRDQTDAKRMREAVAAAEHARARKGGPGTATSNELPQAVHRGDTMWALARNHGDQLSDLIKANPQIRHPNRIQPGQIVFVPTKDPTIVKTRQQAVAAATADRSVASLEARLRNPKLSPGVRKNIGADLANAKADASSRWTAAEKSIEDELRNGGAGASLPDDAIRSLVTQIHARVPESEKFQNAVSAAFGTVEGERRAQRTTRAQLDELVSRARQQSDPLAALQALNGDYPQSVKDAILRDPDAIKIIDKTVAWANLPLGKADGTVRPEAQTRAAIHRLDQATQGFDKNLAAAVVDRAAPAYEQFNKDHQGKLPLGLFGSLGLTTLVNLSGRVAGSAQGDDAISRFAAMKAWNGAAVRNAIATGADPAYAIELARQLKEKSVDPEIVAETIAEGIGMRDGEKIASGDSPAATIDVARRMQAAGLDSSGVMKVATEGVQQFKDQVAGDVRKLAEHDAELAWLVRNDGAGMSAQQLSSLVANYRKDKGAAWQADETQLGRQIALDGTKLIDQMNALNQLPPQLSGSRATIDQTLKTIANDPAASVAISAGIQSDPRVGDPKHVKDVADIFALSKVGDVGRKYTNELASAVLRSRVFSRLQGVNLQDPASVGEAKEAIRSISDETFARLVGVTPSDLDKAVKQVQIAADKTAAARTPEEVAAALRELDKKLGTDAQLSKAFNKTTPPGQMLRGAAVIFAGASLINSSTKFNANPSDPQNGIKLLLDAAGFAQKNSELVVGLGLVSKNSAIGQFGGEWKLVGRATAGDLINGVSAVLDLISAARSGFGLGVPQDTGDAIFSLTTATGGGLAVAPAFGAPAVLGGIGLGITLLGVGGKAIYESEKDAHRYESASKKLLMAAGYNEAAADALSRQGGIASGAAGSAQMPFLTKYAQLKGMTRDQLVKWINSLTQDQVKHLSARLLQAAGDCSGNPDQFTAGPARTAEISDYDSPYAVTVPVANTISVFDSYLAYDHVRHP